MCSNTSIKEILYFPSTHWDREWYLSFQSFRFRLVTVMQDVLTTLETCPKFSAFLCDGQTVMIEDYLEIIPEDRARIEKLLNSGRLKIGPWYTMPDENLVSGESLIANLNMGHDTLAQLTSNAEVLPLGYLCDIFGHISQMPQILNGFGIKNAVLGRGTNQSDLPSFFTWESPDKSRCTTFKVPESCGYGSFWFDVFSENRKASSIEESAINYVKEELSRSSLPFVILMDGMDHTPIHPEAVHLADVLKNHFSCNVSIGDVSSFFQHLQKYAPDLPVKSGELKAPAQAIEEHNKLISGTLSSRYDLKKTNDNVQTLLEKMALPASSLASICGYPVPQGFETLAYKYLLKNHAHDSICGCSVDEVHQDMLYRYRQSEQIGTEIYESALLLFLANTQTESIQLPDSNLLLTLFNPLPFHMNKVITAEIAFPLDYPKEKYALIPSEAVNSFLIYDCEGSELPYQIESIVKSTNVRNPLEYYGSTKDVYTVSFKTTVPAMGKSEFLITPSPHPVRCYRSLKTSQLSAQNEFLRLDISNSGEITLTDLKNNHTYANLIAYKDCGETGDGWNSSPSVPDSIHHSGICTDVAIVSDGPAKQTFCITHQLQLPEKMEYHRQFTRRGSRFQLLTVRTYISLEENSKKLNCCTIVQNNIKDHRFIFCLRSGINSETYFAEEAFSFIERPAGRTGVTENWKEEEREEKSFGNIVFRKREDGSGLAFLSKGGLHESACHRLEDGSIDITLFRSFDKTFLTDGQPDGQLQQEMEFEYSILPFGTNTDAIDLLSELDTLRVNPYCITTFTDKVSSDCLVTKSYGFYLEEHTLYISLIKPSKKNTRQIVVRLVNYNSAITTDTLHCPTLLTDVCECSLLEEIKHTVPFHNQAIPISLNPHEVRTYLLTFQTDYNVTN